ncbi:glycosyltransferase family 39 protein [Candidatus Gottesmanbacteria bacterium]|nr:glycosyltransferase family 39 protein [Candidatus Gottesmanbacteria bacterium]
MKKLTVFLLLALVILDIGVRLYHVTSPVADWHSWRQSDTAAVARNFIKRGFDPFRPRYDDLSNIQSGKDNPQGYRMVEFPLYQTIGFGLWKIFPKLSIEESLRIVSIFSSVVSVVTLFYIASVIRSPVVGFFSALTFALLPYNVYFGRVILPESFMVSLVLVSIAVGLYASISRGSAKYVLFFVSALCSALAFLVKPTAGFFLLPLLPIFIAGFGVSFESIVLALLYITVSIVPLLLWRKWILQFPEGIPVFEWLFNGNGIRFTPAWLRWIFSERIAQLILGSWGLVFLCLGMLGSKNRREAWFIFLWIAGVLGYVAIVATGNVQHDYYQVPLIPVISYLVGRGMLILWRVAEKERIAGVIIIGCVYVLMVTIPWYTMKTYYWINRQAIVDAGSFADRVLPKDAKVIAPYNGDTTFLYQTNRPGWPLGFDIAQKIKFGATHYVTVSPTDLDLETRDLTNMYTVVERNEQFAIIDLTKPRKAP